MIDCAAKKATCGFTSVRQRCANHSIAGKAFVLHKERVSTLLGSKGRMVAVQMAKKAPEMPPVVSPTEGEVCIELCDLHSSQSFNEMRYYEK